MSNYLQECGFESEVERLQLILTVPIRQMDELERWMDLDGTKAGLLKILHPEPEEGGK